MPIGMYILINDDDSIFHRSINSKKCTDRHVYISKDWKSDWIGIRISMLIMYITYIQSL